jgi:hypothetical protein
MEAWKTFYRPYFESEKQFVDFIAICEGLEHDDKKHRAKIMMHQGQRLISLSAHAAALDGDKDPLKLFFLIVCAEAVAKLYADYKNEGQSKKFVRYFYQRFCMDGEKRALLEGLELCGVKPALEKVIDALYRVRCDVVHEGQYWGFSFATAKHRSMLSGREGQVMRVAMTYDELKSIVCNGVIRATKQIAGISP